MKTLEIYKNTEYKEIFFIPRKFPFDINFNFILLVIKTAVYYIYLIKSYKAISNYLEQATFVWSFFEIAACLYFNKRENENKKEMKK